MSVGDFFFGKKIHQMKTILRVFFVAAINDEATMNITLDKNLSIVWCFF